MIPPGLFVTGTDTGVGKTRVASAIVRSLANDGLRVGALKPVSTSAIAGPDGTFASPDALDLRTALGWEAPLDRITPLLYPGDLAPSVAMRLAGRPVDFRTLLETTIAALEWWGERSEIGIVEGVGGLLCPLTSDSTVADLAVALDYPLIIVARRGLGTLNHTLLTVEAARWRGLRIAGVILNGSEPTTNPTAEATNPGELAGRIGGAAILVDSPHLPTPEALNEAILGVDWKGLACPPRLPPGVVVAPPA